MRRIAFLVVFIASRALAALGDELTVPQALDLFEQATKAIQHYDVTVKVHRRFSLTAEIVGTKKKVGPIEQPIIEWRSLRPGEAASEQIHLSRQVRDARGRRHIEERNPATGQVETVITFDGEIRRSLVEKTKHGYLGPPSGHYIGDDEDYINFYANVFGHSPLASRLRREGTRLIDDPAHPLSTVIDSPPLVGRGQSVFGYTVWLDPEHGMLPSQIEIKQRDADGDVLLSGRMVIREFTRLENGAWAPVKAVTTRFVKSGPLKGSASQEAVATVDIARSTWNKPLADSLFTIAFPPGTSILDDLRKVTFVTGNPQREANLDRLAAQARNVMDNAPSAPPAPPPRNWTLWAIVAANVLLLVALAALIWYRSARRRSVM
jgi:hypothetical protein